MTDPDPGPELERHHEAAFGWALSCCGWDRNEAEDVLHATYLKILDGRAAYAGRSSFKTWLFAVIRRTAAEHRRRAVVRRVVPLHLLDSHAAARDPDDPDRAFTRADTTRRLLAALEALPPRQRQVLHLVFYENLTIREAAAVLGVGIGTARTHYERGKTALRQRLRNETDV